MARMVYLGTPEIAVEPLRTLVGMGHDIALVVSRPDARRGRGGALMPSPVKAAAVELGIGVTSSLDDVLESGAELGVVVAYGRIIPAGVLQCVPMVNLHFSRLPRWRGAAPVERAVLAGDGEIGVCLMAVESGLDTGDIYADETTTIDETESVDELRRRLAQIGCRLLEEHLATGVAGLPVPSPQVGEPTYAEKIRPEELELHWELDASHLRRVLRLGRAWTTFRGRRLRVLRADSVAPPREKEPPPVVTGPTPSGGIALALGGISPALEGDSPGSLRGEEVVTGGGTRLRLVAVQPEGKQPMAASEWLRGMRPHPEERLGD
ncbi:MAG: methionyl-tRNA formyltransferase [Acidimicrobiales bacterium]